MNPNDACIVLLASPVLAMSGEEIECRGTAQTAPGVVTTWIGGDDVPDRTRAEERYRERLLRFFVPGPDDECWLWLGSLKTHGYGQFTKWGPSGKRTTQCAHRAVYEAVVGPIPEGLELDHLCRNRACVNPAHMEPVTRSENIKRARPFMPRGTDNHNGAKTHCPQGHPYSPENTYRTSVNRRMCRICRDERVRRWREDHRQPV